MQWKVHQSLCEAYTHWDLLTGTAKQLVLLKLCHGDAAALWLGKTDRASPPGDYRGLFRSQHGYCRLRSKSSRPVKGLLSRTDKILIRSLGQKTLAGTVDLPILLREDLVHFAHHMTVMQTSCTTNSKVTWMQKQEDKAPVGRGCWFLVKSNFGFFCHFFG